MRPCVSHDRLGQPAARVLSRRPAVYVISYRSAAGLAADYEANLARGSLFVNTRHLLPVGATVRLVLVLSEPSFRVVLEGVVTKVRSFGNDLNDTPGMQVRLKKSSAASRLLLREFVSQLLAANQSTWSTGCDEGLRLRS